MRLRARTSAASLLVASALVMTGCSSTGGDKAPEQTAKEKTPAERLESAKEHLDAAKGYHFVLQGTDVPKDTSGVLAGKGDVQAGPKFKGTLTVQAGTISASVPVVALDGKTWAKMPFSDSMKPIKPESYGAPDPNKLFSKDTGVSNLLPKTKSPKAGGELREGADVVQSFKGTLDGKDVKSVLNMGDGTGTFQVEYTLTAKDEIRSAQLVGPFFKGSKTTYNLKFTEFGKTVDIQAP